MSDTQDTPNASQLTNETIFSIEQVRLMIEKLEESKTKLVQRLENTTLKLSQDIEQHDTLLSILRSVRNSEENIGS